MSRVRNPETGAGVEGATLDDVLDEVRQISARAAASTVLALAENLARIVDASALRPDDVERRMERGRPGQQDDGHS
jgi:hypothetical protein